MSSLVASAEANATNNGENMRVWHPSHAEEELQRQRQRCEGVLMLLAEVAQHCLQPGWLLVPFGSYIQDTCLSKAILDVALVFIGKEASHRTAKHGRPSASCAGALHSFAEVLTTETPNFRHAASGERGRLADTAAEMPVGLVCGDITSGRFVHSQDVMLYLGDVFTGHIDNLLFKILQTDSRARAHVRAVKTWAREQGFDTVCPFPVVTTRHRQGVNRGSLFTWTLLAVFGLQQLRLLPPLKLVNSFKDSTNWVHFGGAPLRSFATQEPDALMRCFAEQMLAYASLPEPRPLMSIWDGVFVPRSSAQSGSMGDQPVIRPHSVGRVLKALRTLQRELDAPPPVPPLPKWLSSPARVPMRSASDCLYTLSPDTKGGTSEIGSSITSGAIASFAPAQVPNLPAFAPLQQLFVESAPTATPASPPSIANVAAKVPANVNMASQSTFLREGAHILNRTRQTPMRVQPLQMLATINEAPERDGTKVAASVQTPPSPSASTASGSDDPRSDAFATLVPQSSDDPHTELFATLVPQFPFEAISKHERVASSPATVRTMPAANSRRRKRATASTQSSSAAAVAAAGVVSSSNSPGRVGSLPPRDARWHVDDSFLAVLRRDGHDCSDGIIEVQLDPHHARCEEMRPADWERRFNRREQQIRLGKVTREYRAWQAHFDECGRGSEDPHTPRVAVQTSKHEFETEYNRWRLKLHVRPSNTFSQDLAP